MTRMLPSRYIQPAPAQVKKQVAQIAHLSPPLKGLNYGTKTSIGDPLTAVKLENFVVEDDRIATRAGYRGVTTVNSVKVLSVSKSNPTVVTVDAADIVRFENVKTVRMAGVTAPGMERVNGKHPISNVGTPANTFTLDDVDTSAATAPMGAGAIVSIPNSGSAVWHLVPWYGAVNRQLAATHTYLWNAENGLPVKGGFAGGDWHWTSFSNLSQQDFTVMVNGVNGVWSWDGSFDVPVDLPPVTVTALSNTSPAQVTVAAADISKFTEGMIVTIAGADPQHAAANGAHVISSVNNPANTFKMVGVDLTATTPVVAPTGITADPPGTGVVQETITVPTGETWVTPNLFHIVVGHMNRLFFADAANLAIYYLPIQRKSGQVKILPLNAYFKRGGYIKAMYTWTIDGGSGLDDKLCIFTSNGECLIYSGSDPDNNFKIDGIYRFDAPMSKHSIVNFGGELYVLVSTGLVPMSTLMRKEGEQETKDSDHSVISVFLRDSLRYGDRPGWQAILNPQSSRVYCNMPQGGTNKYNQMVRHMHKAVWSEFRSVPARCWSWVQPYMWFADDRGNIYQGHPTFLNDDGRAIQCKVQMAWGQFKTPGIKKFNLLKTYYTSDGEVKAAVDMKVDFDFTRPENIPDITFRQPGAVWDEADWAKSATDPGGSYWAAGPIPTSTWNGVGRMGRVGSVRLDVAIQDCEYSITGFDLIYETGAAVG